MDWIPAVLTRLGGRLSGTTNRSYRLLQSGERDETGLLTAQFRLRLGRTSKQSGARNLPCTVARVALSLPLFSSLTVGTHICSALNQL